MALFVLRQMGVTVEQEVLKTVQWISHWRCVVDCLDRHLPRKEEDDRFLQESYLIWTHFLTASYPRLPLIRKPEAWAAAVEYVVRAINQMESSKKELAARYGITVPTLTQKIRVLKQCISLDLEGKNG